MSKSSIDNWRSMVRISDAASLYSLCRSRLKNGSPEESQLQYGDGVKSLPRPLPIPVSDTSVVKQKEDEEDDVETDEDENVDHLSAEDLLRRHVHHAKRIQSQLRDERIKRIDRYKTRLSLLLPLLVEQSRNDAPPANWSDHQDSALMDITREFYYASKKRGTRVL